MSRFKAILPLRLMEWPTSLWIIGFFAYLPTFFIRVLSSDEAGWATMSRYIFSGQFYERISDNKPPFHFQIHWLASLGENSVLSLKIFVWLWTCFGAYGLYKCLLHFTKPDAAKYSAYLFALYSGLINSGAYTGERIITPLCIWATYLACSTLKAQSKTYLKSFFIGALVGAAFQTKQTAIFLCVPAMWILTFSSKNIVESFFRISLAVLGGLSISFISWQAVGIPFEVIWREAFQTNFSYIKVLNAETAEGLKDLLGNIILILGFEYLPLVLGTLALLFVVLKNSPHRKSLLNLRSNTFLGFLLLASSIACLSMGGRFYQQYFSVLLPALCVLAALPLTPISTRKIMISGFWIVLSLHTFTVWRQITDNNRNWNSQIINLHEKIERDTLPTDTIWISNSIYSAYWLTDRAPAVRYLYFLQVLNYIDPCRAHDDQMKEPTANDHFEKLLGDLKNNDPKIIFWTQHPRNNCSDRLKLENFPSIVRFISAKYEQVSNDEFGIYFRRLP